MRCEGPRTLASEHAANVVNGGIVGGLIWDAAGAVTVTAWWIAIAVMSVGRGLAARRFMHDSSSEPIERWATKFTWGSLASGSIWGLGSAVLFPADDGTLQLLLAFVIGGMAAGASSSLACHLPAFYAFVLPSVLPLAARFALCGERFQLGIALMLVLFATLVSGIAKRAHRTFVDGFGLSFENESLVAELRAASVTLEERVEERTERLVVESAARRTAEQALQRAGRLDAVGRLTGGVAHDFGNLLTIIVNNLEVLDTRDFPGDDGARVRVALDASVRGGELVRNLLTFSRRQQLRVQVVDVRDIVRRLAEQMLVPLLPSTIDVRFDCGDEPRLARVDEAQLEAAVLNLALNARDALVGAGGTLAINVSTRRIEGSDPDVAPGSYVAIGVHDDGEGLDSESLERAFEPFFTTKGEAGTGLGLSMVYGFARQSGGIVRLESEVGRGTAATILLPQHTGRIPAQVDVPTDAALVSGGELLLVVDDEPDVRRATVQLVRSLGYQAVEAGDASQALSLLETDIPVRLLMTDVVMPGTMDGRALAETVARKYPAVAVLIVSGGAAARDASSQLPSLAKPYRRKELARALREALVRRTDCREHRTP
ncbi:MAG: response regulator [Nannocystaceae bacterium]|nr:response regulator [Nannocystaceae bacterium]